MNFFHIDPIIEQWSRDNSLPLCTTYRDSDVRSVEMILPSGDRRQMWIETNGKTTVSVWDYKKRRKDLTVGSSSLRDCLDEALLIAKSWT